MKGRLTLRRLIVAETTWGTVALDVQTSDMRTLGTGSDIALRRTVRLTWYLLSLTPVPLRGSVSPVVGGRDGLLLNELRRRTQQQKLSSNATRLVATVGLDLPESCGRNRERY